jgi:hypothetical protein
MKFIIATFLSALLAFAGGLFFDWWIIAVTSFLVGLLIFQKRGWAYLASFTGVSLLWTALAMIIDFENHYLLSAKVAGILPLGGSSQLLIMLTSLVGGIVSGFAAMTGSLLRRLFVKRNYNRNEVVVVT